jgi:hypothetical protein
MIESGSVTNGGAPHPFANDAGVGTPEQQELQRVQRFHQYQEEIIAHQSGSPTPSARWEGGIFMTNDNGTSGAGHANELSGSAARRRAKKKARLNA